MNFEKIKNFLFLSGGVAIAVLLLKESQKDKFDRVSADVYTQATNEDVITSGDTRRQYTGFTPPSSIPGRGAMYSAERGNNVPGGYKPRSVPVVRNKGSMPGRNF